jgi:hypothetical protein
VRERHARDDAGNGDRARALHVAIVLDARPGEQIGRFAAHDGVIRRIQSAGRAHAVVDDVGLRLGGAPQHHAAAGRHAAHPGLHHADRERRGDRGVDRVAARLEDRGADFGGALVLRRDHAAARRDDTLANQLRVGEVVAQVTRPARR